MNTFSEPKRTAGLAAVFALSFFLGIGSMLAGCAKKPEASAKPRPVKAVRIAADGDATPLTFSGEVRARYETTLARLQIQPSPGVRLEMLRAGQDGWSALAIHPALPGRSCVVYAGDVTVPPRTRMQGRRGALPGDVVCDSL